MPSGLSGGQKKRVGVARATVTRAPIVLYDEPAAGLDPVTSQKIFELLRAEQRASGATVVMVSSDLDRLLTVTDRVGMMYRGSLVFDGTTEEAKASRVPVVRQFVHGLTDGPAVIGTKDWQVVEAGAGDRRDDDRGRSSSSLGTRSG